MSPWSDLGGAIENRNSALFDSHPSTKDVRQAEKQAQQEKAWDLWLDCWTQEAIADAVDVPRKTVSDWLAKSAELRESPEPPESRQSGMA